MSFKISCSRNIDQTVCYNKLCVVMENEIKSLLTLYGMAYYLERHGIVVRALDSKLWVPQSLIAKIVFTFGTHFQIQFTNKTKY